jgi:CBS domain-containing protein/osmotically-inducible protein OsmY
MAERDRFQQRNDERGSRDTGQERAGAYRGDAGASRGGAGGGRSEFGGYGGSGYGGASAGGYGGQTRDWGEQGGREASWGGQQGQRGGMHDYGEGGYGGRGASESGASRAWSESQSLGTSRQPFESRGEGSDPMRRWSGESWTDRERYGSGGGTGYSGPSGLGWQTDAGYGAGATGYGGSGRGALGEWSSGRGGAGSSGMGSQGMGSTGSGMGSGSAGSMGSAAMRNRGPKGWQRSDERIHDDVCERLANEPGIDPSEVIVEVNGGNVVLTGSVPDRGMKYRIEDIVDGCSGVRDVDNRLRVNRGGMGGLLGTGTMGMGTTTDARSGASGGSDTGSRGSLLGRLFGFTTGAKLSDIMTRNPRTVSPDETLDKVAMAMKEQDVGAIPVCSGRKLEGMITDRDIVVRAAAAGRTLAQTKVREVMTSQVHTCYEDDDVESALDKMGDLQIRRIPVVDRSSQLVGIVSLGDFAQRDTGDVEDALQDISKPTNA